MVKVPLKIRGNADVHTRGNGLVDVATVVFSFGEEAVEDVVLIGGDGELSDGEAHAFGVVPCEDVCSEERRSKATTLV